MQKLSIEAVQKEFSQNILVGFYFLMGIDDK